VHVAVRHIEGYQGVPSSDLDEGSDVHEREAVIGEEALGPAGDDACLGVGKSGVAEVVDAVLVEGFEVGVIMLRIGGREDGFVLFGFLVDVLAFEGEGYDVHVGPEIVVPII